MIRGIDVSDFQPDRNWTAVAAGGMEFAISKATEGTGFFASTFPSNWINIKKAGLVRGAYHFARPNANTPTEEANFFLSQVLSVQELEEGDVLCLDLEAGSGDLSDWALTWLKHVQDKVGFRPFLYGSPSFLNEHGCTGNADLAEYGLWLAHYGLPALPSPPPPWPFIAMWQYTDNATVAGIGGPCDADIFTGSVAQLRRYGKPGPGNTPAPGAPRRGGAGPRGGTPLDVETYVVQSGDTMSGIADSKGVTLQALIAANPQVKDPNVIFPGQVLTIP